MKLFNYIIFLLTLVLVTSCEDESDNVNQMNNNSIYEGFWQGTFDGDDVGNWNAEILSDGSITAELNSTKFNYSASASGTLSNSGEISLTFGTTTTGAVFSGQFTTSNASGMWVNDYHQYQGNWTGQPQSSLQ